VPFTYDSGFCTIIQAQFEIFKIIRQESQISPILKAIEITATYLVRSYLHIKVEDMSIFRESLGLCLYLYSL